MQLFLEEDRARGVLMDERFSCDACRRLRPRAGAIQYGHWRFCNRCAIAYELAVARGQTSDPESYLRALRTRGGGVAAPGRWEEQDARQRQEWTEGQRWHQTSSEQEGQGEETLTAARPAVFV